jgi:K+-transporting ATPase A subunit
MPFKPGDRVRTVRPIGLTIPIAVGSVGTVVNLDDWGPDMGACLGVNMDAPFENEDTFIEAFDTAWETVV